MKPASPMPSRKRKTTSMGDDTATACNEAVAPEGFPCRMGGAARERRVQLEAGGHAAARPPAHDRARRGDTDAALGARGLAATEVMELLGRRGCQNSHSGTRRRRKSCPQRAMNGRRRPSAQKKTTEIMAHWERGSGRGQAQEPRPPTTMYRRRWLPCRSTGYPKQQRGPRVPWLVPG